MRVMRRQEKQMTDEDALEILKGGEYGILSTVDGEGQPYGTPLNYVLVDKALYIHTALQGYALDNIAGNHRVCFTVVGRTQVKPEAFTTTYESVVVFGQAGLTDETQKVEIMKEFVKKYSPEHQEKGFQAAENFKDKTTVVKIDITHLTGKRKL